MCISSTRRLFGRTVLAALLVGTSSCGPPPVRIPLAVPLPAVGGSRPATPQGLYLFADFGDGLWGQEQERVEIGGGGAGFALRDRFEFNGLGYRPRGSGTAAETTGVRGKIRLGDFKGGKASVGVHVARMTSERESTGLQDERLTAWDVALPVTFYPVRDELIDRRWSAYAAPRLVFQAFEDRLAGETSSGTAAAIVVGVAGRLRYLAVTAEMNLAHTPSMSFGNTTFQGGWILLPVAGFSVMLPIGD